MPDGESERGVICGQLEAASRSFAFNRLVFAVVGQHAPGPAMGSEWPRLVMILEGTRDIVLPLRSGVERLHLVAGDAYYATPYSWESYSWNTPLRMLCVVPRVSYTRVSYYDQAQAVQPPPVPSYHHTSRTYSDSMRCTVEALNALPWLAEHGAAPDLARALVRLALYECRHDTQASAGKGRATFERIRSWLENCFQEDVDREATAAQFGLTATYLSRLFQTMTGVGFHHYLTGLRMDHAKHLLRETSLSVKEIAGQAGFRNPVHFVRRFRELNGVAPGRYRQTRVTAS